MDPVIALTAAAPLGGKAGVLARLLAAGLPVPDGVVVTASAFAAIAGAGEVALDDVGHRLGELAAAVDDGELPAALTAAVDAAAARLAPLAVRSSMSIEDAEGGAAPGVFASRTAVAAAAVWPAIRAVWASAIAPLAVAYARHRGVAGVRVAVIVQRFVAGEPVTVYTRPPGRPDGDELWIAPAHGALRRVGRASDDPIATLALAAERVLDARDGADVELVIDGEQRAWLVQARPIVHPRASRAPVPPPPALLAFSARTPGLTWRRDVGHNPDPLSPAQAGLVDAVVRAGVAPGRLHVAAGYLYYADDEPAPHHRDAGAIAGGPALREHFDALATAMAASLPVEPPRDLVDALAAYLACYRIFAVEVAPLVARARRVLPTLLASRDAGRADALAARLVPRRGGALDAAVVAAARGELDDDALLAMAADHAPAWDVAAPTFGEQPALVRAAVERVRGALAALSPAAPASIDEVAAELELPRATVADAVDIARVAATIAEEDDAWFARAQAMMRRALLDAGRRLGLDDPEDACWLPLDELLAADAGAPLDPVTAQGRAGGARNAAARSRSWAMPLLVRDGAAIAAIERDDDDGWRGVGTGARVVGAVHRIDDLTRAALVPAGAIAVVATVTPALALLLAGARAIVSEHGGVLDHGAAIARELGVPCVVGCTGAWQALRDGELVEVDGDGGVVTRA